MWLEVLDASRRLGSRLAIDAISFALEQGEIACLLGPSGCGKTTTLRCIAGFEGLDSGRIISRGRLLSGPGVQLAPHLREIGFVFQDLALFPHLTARGNVEFGLHQLARAERRARAVDMLRLVGLEDFGDAYPSQLSGGQQQRVALARALANDPPILLADEPTGNLDSKTGQEILALIDMLHAQGNTILLVTHEEELAAHAARVIRLRDGKIVADERKASDRS